MCSKCWGSSCVGGESQELVLMEEFPAVSGERRWCKTEQVVYPRTCLRWSRPRWCTPSLKKTKKKHLASALSRPSSDFRRPGGPSARGSRHMPTRRPAADTCPRGGGQQTHAHEEAGSRVPLTLSEGGAKAQLQTETCSRPWRECCRRGLIQHAHTKHTQADTTLPRYVAKARQHDKVSGRDSAGDTGVWAGEWR